MNNYLEFNFKISPLHPWNEILMAELIEIGFDSFTEEHDGILAYIQKDLLNEEDLKEVSTLNNNEVTTSYTFQEIIDKNKDGKVVGVVQTNIITQKGKKVFRIPITASGTNSPTVGDAINLTEEATGKIVGVSEINGTDGLEIIAQKKKDVTYGPAESGNATLDLWTDKGIDKDGQLGKVIAPK